MKIHLCALYLIIKNSYSYNTEQPYKLITVCCKAVQYMGNINTMRRWFIHGKQLNLLFSCWCY